MIQQNELRIGNYITSGNYIGKVLLIGSEEKGFEKIYCECEEYYEWFYDYYGILLTEQWLLDFGFCLNDNCNYEIFVGEFTLKYDKEKLTLEGNGGYDDNGTMELSHIKYVHTLQNLYYALTGKELEYNKNNQC